MTHRPLPGPRVEVVAGRESTGGAYALFDVRAPAGTAIPPHRHQDRVSTLLLLEGRLRVLHDAGWTALDPGDVARIEPSEPCRLEAQADVRLLVLTVPAGLEALTGLAGATTAPDPDDVAALLAASGVALLPSAWGAAA
ncbi:cupin domain-containing protein [Patulibacter minatonensis]|uniref:AraC-like ligand-binding domain-containing protein n=1 Tax=Patulibacter minatonensis TaxID=298163 RepID=UPI0004B8C169|nr:cupin domain-containing protein [Patulibacter minatonensis]